MGLRPTHSDENPAPVMLSNAKHLLFPWQTSRFFVGRRGDLLRMTRSRECGDAAEWPQRVIFEGAAEQWGWLCVLAGFKEES